MGMKRSCTDYRANLERSSFSANQWGKGSGASRCHSCVHGGGGGLSSKGSASATRRENKSSSASFTSYDLSRPFAQGAFRWVAKGHYTDGPRNGEQALPNGSSRGV